MALDADDLEPHKPKQAPLDLEKMSVEELKNYVADMEQEIAAGAGCHRRQTDSSKFGRKRIQGVGHYAGQATWCLALAPRSIAAAINRSRSKLYRSNSSRRASS